MHIVIHAGPPKFGAPTLQSALWRQQTILSDAGIELVAPPKPGQWSLLALFSRPEAPVPAALAERFATREEMLAWSEAAWAEFETRLDQARADMVLVPIERLAGVHDKEAMLARLLKRAERLSIVAYAQDPVAVYVAQIDHAIGAGQDFAMLRKPAGFRYATQGMHGFAPLLPARDLVIRPADTEDPSGGNAVTDFFQVLSGLVQRPVPVEIPPPRQGESLCGAAMVWLLSANALGPFHGEARNDRTALLNTLRDDETLKDLPRLRMTDPEIATAIRTNSRETIDWLNAGPLAHAPLESAPPDATPLPAPQLRERLRRWLLSYGCEDDMRLVMKAIIRHGVANLG